jgi:hypothetical protein
LDCPWLFQRKKVEQQAEEDIEVLQGLVQVLGLGDDTRLESLEDSPREDGGNTGTD